MSTKVFFFLLTLFFLLPSMGDAKNHPSGAKQTKETILSTKDSTTHQYARLNPLLPLSQKISQSTWKGIRGALWTVWSVCGLTLLSLIMVLLIVKKGWFNRLSMTIWWLILIGWEFALLLYAALDDPQYSCVHAFATFSFSWDKILYFFVLLISTLFVLAAFYFSTATFKEMLELKMPLLYLSPLILIGLIFITFIVLSFVVNNEQLQHIQPRTRKWDSLWISDIGTNGARYRPDLQTPSALLPDDRLCPTHHDRFDLSDIPHFHNGIYPADLCFCCPIPADSSCIKYERIA